MGSGTVSRQRVSELVSTVGHSARVWRDWENCLVVLENIPDPHSMFPKLRWASKKVYLHGMLIFKEQFAPTVPKEQSITLKVVIIFIFLDLF